jgi:hypothetical protein
MVVAVIALLFPRPAPAAQTTAGPIAETQPGVDSASPFVLRGTLLDEDGKPLAKPFSLEVGLHLGVDRYEAGRYEVTLTDAKPGHLVVQCRHASAVAVRVLDVREGQTEATLSIRFGEEAVAKGRLVTRPVPLERRPVGVAAGARAQQYNEIDNVIWLNGTVADRPFFTRLNPSEDGSFLVDGYVLRGSEISASAPHHLQSPRSRLEPPFPMQVVLRPVPMSMISGQILDADGQPVPGALVLCGSDVGNVWRWRGRALTEADGRFLLEDLPPGDYHIEALALGFAQNGVTLSVRPEEQVSGLVIRLAPGPSQHVTGRVVGPDGSSGMPGAKILLRVAVYAPPPRNGPPEVLPGGMMVEDIYLETASTTVTTPSGDFALDLMASSPRAPLLRVRRVDVSAVGYATATYSGFDVTPGDMGPLTYQLQRGSHLGGIVRLADGSIPPIDNSDNASELRFQVRIEVRLRSTPATPSPEDAWAYKGWIDLTPGAGRFDYFAPLPPGETRLTVHIPGHPDYVTTITLRDGESADVAIRLPY